MLDAILCLLIAANIVVVPKPKLKLGMTTSLLYAFTTFGSALYAYIDAAKAQRSGIRYDSASK